MRASKLALVTLIGLLSATAATAQTLPTPGETPAQRAARREAMPPPVLQEDEALQSAIGSDTRPAADIAREA